MKAGHIITMLFFGLALVLVVTHPEGFAGAVTAVGGQTYQESALLTGAGQTGGTTGPVTSSGGPNYTIG